MASNNKGKAPTNKKELLEARKKAYRHYVSHNGSVKVSWLSYLTGLTEEQLIKYRKKDKWDERWEKQKIEEQEAIAKGVKGNGTHQELEDAELNQIQLILDQSGLPPKRELFVLHYLQTYNKKQAAIKAGFSTRSANSRGNECLLDPRVHEAITRIKTVMSKSLYLSARDIVDEYIKVAFADITDYVEFDKQTVNLKDSEQVDGSLITEVKQGRDGITIKLADKMKALERLEKLFEIMPDRKLQLEKEKFEWTKQISDQGNGENKNVTIINDIR
jgi:phage terminase small subunit